MLRRKKRIILITTILLVFIVGSIGLFPAASTSTMTFMNIGLIILTLSLFPLLGASIVKMFQQSRAYSVVKKYLINTGWTMDTSIDVTTSLSRNMFGLHDPEVFTYTNRQLFGRNPQDPGMLLGFYEFSVATRPTADSANPLGGHSLLLAMKTLPGSIDGWVSIAPIGLATKYFDDVDLESYQFNREVYLRAEPVKLATYVFSPTFMEWYLAQSERPSIFLENNGLFLCQYGKITPAGIDLMVHQMNEIMSQLEHSGALEQTPKGE